ncbi:ATP-binding protein [Amycolatopsis cynarae]|uniref:ATP-binding protein n=1 Tax=Amycolatopsis cynarae TaxID=2995223 RepID=A0ABY7BCL7_9PSEU|nr:ATP-binding protein [Amycolatopsis sp. HUAS 11-8]WAL68992.1 ATP-binding protein [Amycolatopsis sp. HUAS 11-8]
MTGDTGVLGPDGAPRLGISLLPTVHAARDARAFVSDALRGWRVPAAAAGDILLAASELVTNAVEHGRGEVSVELEREGSRIRLRVGDHATERPVLRKPDARSPRGRGMALIDALSAAWGHYPRAVGKWVWAEFRLDA